MKSVIGTYFKSEKSAMEHAKKMEDMWKGRVTYYIACFNNGYLVISESQI